MNGYYQDIDEREERNESDPPNTPTQIERIQGDNPFHVLNSSGIINSHALYTTNNLFFDLFSSLVDTRLPDTVANETTPLLNNRNNNVYAETDNNRRYLYRYGGDTPIELRRLYLSDTENIPENSSSTQPTNQNPHINNLIGSYNPRINSREILRRYYEIQDKNKKEILDSNGNPITKHVKKNTFGIDR